MGPIFFEDTGNSDHYYADILTNFISQQMISDAKSNHGWFPHVDDTVYIPVRSMTFLWNVFG